MITKVYTSEAVSEGHPDKVSDQISDAILDLYLARDPEARVACETLVTKDKIIVAGEITSRAPFTKADRERVARSVVHDLGYDTFGFNSFTVSYEDLVHEQSRDINQCVTKDIVAGDQGIMFGYATNECPEYIPLGLAIARKILLCLSIRRRKSAPFLGPDAKCLVTVVESDEHKPHIADVLVSTQHTNKASTEEIYNTVKTVVGSVLYDYESYIFDYEHFNLTVNPSGRFVEGGPAADTGLTGRKIIVDTYGGACPHGGGAFSGKDPSKVDRSAAYYARFIANHLVCAGCCDKVVVSLSYAIGSNLPIIVELDTLGTNKTGYSDNVLANLLFATQDIFNPSTENYIPTYRYPIYSTTARYGHFGRNRSFPKEVHYLNAEGRTQKAETYPWEVIDCEIINKIKRALQD